MILVLKNCPFCGAEPEVTVRKSYNPQDVTQINIRCSRHGCMGRNHRWLTDKEYAVQSWNQRAKRSIENERHRKPVRI